MTQTDPLPAIQADLQQGRLQEAAQKCLAALRSDPRNVAVMGVYGDVATVLRRPDDAIIIFRKLLQVSPGHVMAHTRLADLYSAQGDLYHAEEHARQALASNPNLPGPHLVLGSVALAKQREAEALQEFETARKLAPGDLQVDAAYVDGLMISGQFERAREILLQLITQNPDNPSLYAQLARTHKLAAGDSDEAIIRSVFDEQGKLPKAIQGNPDLCNTAHMAMFKLEADLGNYASAFQHLEQAKEIRRPDIKYKPEEAETSFRKVRKVFTAELTRNIATAGSQADDPVFVVGMPRSGTTLLERVLSAHPDVAAAGELPIAEQLRQEVCARFGKNQYDTEALAKVPAAVWRQAGDEYILRARRWMPDGKHFVDKMPGNFKNLGFIRAMLPRAKIVHISRHPVATCLSIYEQSFANGHEFANDLVSLGLYYLQYVQQMDHWRTLFGQDIIEIDYESLVADKNAASDWLQQRLELTTTGDAPASTEEGGIIRTASVWQARQPVHTDSVARWENYREQLKPLLDTLAPILDTAKPA